MNEDPASPASGLRRALADLERDLGPGVAAALARTADLLRDDADHLDGLADAGRGGLGAGPWAVEELAALPRARPLAACGGACSSRPGRRPVSSAARHADACDRLLTAWHGQGPVHAPGDLRVSGSTVGSHHPCGSG